MHDSLRDRNVLPRPQMDFGKTYDQIHTAWNFSINSPLYIGEGLIRVLPYIGPEMAQHSS